MYWKQTSVYHPRGSRGLMVRESEKVMGLSNKYWQGL